MKRVVCRCKPGKSMHEHFQSTTIQLIYSSVMWHEDKGKCEFPSECRDVCKEDQQRMSRRVTSILAANSSCILNPQNQRFLYWGRMDIQRGMCIYRNLSIPLGIKAKDEELKSLLYFQKCSSMKEL